MKKMLEELLEELKKTHITMEEFEGISDKINEDTNNDDKIEITRNDFRRAFMKVSRIKENHHEIAKLDDMLSVTLDLEIIDYTNRLEQELFDNKQKKKAKADDETKIDNDNFNKIIDDTIKTFDSNFIYKKLDYKAKLKEFSNKLKEDLKEIKTDKITRKKFREKVSVIGIEMSASLVKKFDNDTLWFTDDLITVAEKIENKIFE